LAIHKKGGCEMANFIASKLTLKKFHFLFLGVLRIAATSAR
jgi:hypothetical protein